MLVSTEFSVNKSSDFKRFATAIGGLEIYFNNLINQLFKYLKLFAKSQKLYLNFNKNYSWKI